MNTTRLDITIPTSLNNDIVRYSNELNKKKSHIIASALDIYYPRKTKQHFENSYFEYDKIRIIKRG